MLAICIVLLLTEGRGLLPAAVAGIVAAAAYEWGRLLGLRSTYAGAYGLALVAGFLIALRLPGGSGTALQFAAALGWIAAAPVWLRIGGRDTGFLLLAGAGAIVPAALSLVLLPASHALLLLSVVWIADSAAYLGGRRFGRHRIAPTISPGKTREGVYCGLAAAVCYALLLAFMVDDFSQILERVGWAGLSVATAIVVVAGIIGDLAESKLKRIAGVKDSGRLLPGHGGVLDRIDSQLAALPVGAALLALTGGIRP